ncbi:DUF3426 domain-containing protein [Noviherbaspirillum sp.]|uniref:DUF3426 domain-containing protein n=1 Tax=Noviherbaspirillum sp. TaxID=1926288 RepID=UPI002FE0CE5B
MALATQCPHCQTTFRVAHDQLKLRSGLVRCGACKQIFNGIENLLRPEEPAPPPVPSTPVADPSPVSPSAFIADPGPQLAPDPEPEQETEAPLDSHSGEVTDPAATDQPEEHHTPDHIIPPTHVADDDPLQRMTLLNFSNTAENEPVDGSPQVVEPPPDPNAPDPLETVIEDLQRKPLRGKRKPRRKTTDALDEADEDESAYQEPSFIKQGRRRQRFGRALRIALVTGTLLLLVGLFAQATYIFRDQLAARFPQTKPALVAACGFIGCRIGLPAQIDAVAIESTELQSLAPDKNIFVLSALLRNHGAIVQAWPHIELTLKDANEKPLARRVFGPADYVRTGPDIQKGLLPKSEHAVKIQFELAHFKAAGYRVYLFYP